MSSAQSPVFIFPPVDWWRQAVRFQEVRLLDAEPFRKMTGRNRYRIATANGPLLLSVPVAGGRTLKAPAAGVLIDHRQDWHKQHWRSLFSAYGRAPFFDHYGPSLERLLYERTPKLTDLSFSALEWVRKELRLDTVFVRGAAAAIPGEAAWITLSDTEAPDPVRYGQVFEDRHGFLPHLSILDLLMNEGPAAKALLMQD